MRKFLFTAAICLMVAVAAGCTSGTSTLPEPSVATLGADVKCPKGDLGYEDPQFQWSFCYPGTWVYSIKAADSTPPGTDLVWNWTNVCGTTCADNGKFGLVIISTYDRGNATDLKAWAAQNLSLDPSATIQTISWGNAEQAVQLDATHRLALTKDYIVQLDIRETPGLLDLNAEFGQRLGTWTFKR